jgi:hypothetical protein
VQSAAELFQDIEAAGLLIDNSWTVKQNDYLDKETSFIYRSANLAELNSSFAERDMHIDSRKYAIHRWRNFKRHEAWLLLLLEEVETTSLPEFRYHKQVDFYITTESEKIPFDLKVTRFPKSAPRQLSDRELAEWFYINQSSEGRFHLGNRFFVVGDPESTLYDLKTALLTVRAFSSEMRRFRHFIDHGNGLSSRAVVLRHPSATIL